MDTLKQLVSQFEDIIKGITGKCKNMEVTFEVDEKKQPYYAKPYRIPVAHIATMKKAIQVMANNNALVPYNGNSPWAAPTFGVPKKNKEIRVVSDFRKLNDAIKRHPWPMPTIQDMLHQCGSMTFSTALDLIMSYYSMNFDLI